MKINLNSPGDPGEITKQAFAYCLRKGNFKECFGEFFNSGYEALGLMHFLPWGNMLRVTIYAPNEGAYSNRAIANVELSTQIASQTLQITGLYVDGIQRRKGIATKLLNASKILAKELGFKYIFLRVERDSWVKIFYEGLGYEYHSAYTPEPGEVGAESLDWMQLTL